MDSKHFGPADLVAMLELEVARLPPPVIDPEDFKPKKSFKDSPRYHQVGVDKQRVRSRVVRRTQSEMVRKPFTAGDGAKVNPRWDPDEHQRIVNIDLTQDPWRVPVIPPHHLALATEIRDRIFRSRRHAARMLGVSLTTICHHMNKGTPDRIGLGVALAPIVTKICDQEYKSQNQAARAKGVRRQTIYSARKRGTLDKVGKGKGTHVEYDNMTFKSFGELGDFLGLHKNTVAHHHKRGTMHLLGKGRGYRADIHKHGEQVASITYRGKEFPDVPTAAKSEGVSESAVYQHVRRTGQRLPC